MWTVLLVAPFGGFGKANSVSTSYGFSGLSIGEVRPTSTAACIKGWVRREKDSVYDDQDVIDELARVGLPEANQQTIWSLVGSAFGALPHLKQGELYRSFKVTELPRSQPSAN